MWRIEGADDAICEVQDSLSLEEVAAMTRKSSHRLPGDLRHHLVSLDGAGSHEVVAETWKPGP